MKSRPYNFVRNSLAMVRKSNVVEATAIIRKALLKDKVDLQSAHVSQTTARPLKGILAQADATTKSRLETGPKPSFRHNEVGLAPKKARNPPRGAGNFTSRIYRHIERDLSYMLYVPPHNSAKEQSLVLMLHGCTQDPNDFALGTQMNNLADEFNLIVAYPLQPKTANSSGCWNWFDARHQKHGAGEPAMLAALADNLRSEFGISENRVFVAGLSAGGAMAEILASTYPQKFSAVGVHSGLPYGAATSLGNAFTAMNGSSKIRPHTCAENLAHSRRIVFHGSSDATVHPSNGERIVGQARHYPGEIKHVEFNKWINGRDVNGTVFMDEDGKSVVEQWVVSGGGHAWFGGNRLGSYTDPKGPDASREMVRFFLEG